MTEYRSPVLQWVASKATPQPSALAQAGSAQVPSELVFSRAYNEKQAATAQPGMRSWNATIDGQPVTVQAPDAASAQALILTEATRIRTQAATADTAQNPANAGYAPGQTPSVVPTDPGLPQAAVTLPQAQAGNLLITIRNQHPEAAGLSDEQVYQQFYLPQVASSVPPTVEQFRANQAAEEAAQAAYEQDRANRPLTQKIGDWTRDLLQGATFGSSDEILAGLAGIQAFVTGGSFSEGASQRWNWEQAQQAAHEAESPLGSQIAQLIGSVTTAVAMQQAGISFMSGAKPSVASMVPRAAAESAAYGAFQGFASGTDWGSRLKGAILSGSAGAVIGAIAGFIGGKISEWQVNRATPTAADIKVASSATFQQARAAGLQVDGQALDDLISATRAARGPTFSSNLTRSSEADRLLINEIGRMGVGSLDDLQRLRSIITNGLDGAEGADRTMLLQMLHGFDQALDALSPTSIIGGGPEAIQIWSNARDLWRLQMKASEIQHIFTDAAARMDPGAGTNRLMNLQRDGFQRLIRDIDRGLITWYSPAEVDAIRAAANGTTVQGILTNLARLAPSNSPLSSSQVLRYGAAGGVGSAIAPLFGGTAPAVGAGAGLAAMGAAGTLAKYGATQAGLSGANLANLMVRNGGGIPYFLPGNALTQAAAVGGTSAAANRLATAGSGQ